MQSEILSNKSNLSTIVTHCIKLQNTKEFLLFPDNYLVMKWQWLLLHIPRLYTTMVYRQLSGQTSYLFNTNI